MPLRINSIELTSKLKLGIDLNVVGEDYKGGVGRYSISLTRALLEIAHSRSLEIYLICNRKNESFLRREFHDLEFIEIIDNNFDTELYQKLHSIAYKLLPFSIFFKLIRSLLNHQHVKKTKFLDLIYCPTTYLNNQGNSKTVVSLHDTQEVTHPENFTKSELSYRKLNREYTLKYTDLIQTSSEFIKCEISKQFTQKKLGKICVIPEGVDTSFFKASQSAKNEEVFQILVPANFHRHKNIQDVIHSLAIIESQRNIKVTLIGEGRFFNECLRLTEDLIRPNVKFEFLGKVDDNRLKEKYSEAHLVISASSYESSSLPLLEGLSSGCVAVASDIQAHFEMAASYPIRIFVLHSHASLAKQIDTIIRDYDLLFSETAIQSRRMSVQKCDWKLIASQYVNQFEELLNR